MNPPPQFLDSGGDDRRDTLGNAAQVRRLPARLAAIGGGIPVARLLPSPTQRMIGAWCFLDHAGPAGFDPGGGMRVGPHPHIGLQTFTWMIEGEVLHRDSLGHVQPIRPGQVNLMTAGHGISHTEESVLGETRLHAAQLWIALPNAAANVAPAFDHYPDLPRWEKDGCRFTLLAGRSDGRIAPTKLYSPLLGVELHSVDGSHVTLETETGFEYGVLPLTGEVRIDGEVFVANELAAMGVRKGVLAFDLAPGTRALLLGGEPFDEPVVLWWNFVGRDRADVAVAMSDWQQRNDRFGRVANYDGPLLEAPALPWS